MKYFCFLTFFLLTISANKLKAQIVNKIEIIKTDSTRDHFIFRTRTETGKESIVLVEKDRVSDCRPLKKFIIADSVHRTSVLKSGSKKDIVGFYLSTIDGIQIRDKGELVKIIWSCSCFIDK